MIVWKQKTLLLNAAGLNISLKVGKRFTEVVVCLDCIGRMSGGGVSIVAIIYMRKDLLLKPYGFTFGLAVIIGEF